ncbi:ABC transporter permease [Tessaracoccus palaemonis]|uniref:ABC transporter permease n=1 Tax=Tessaracoccus palaemonis TaxID=2829499 RepID=A0ABX8SJQ7_9ACTN|nr:ABC transporter permease [Tessaracoccus palaemonis]QXT63578.1 ABC transporter permease [Tessaracoccus palaemonis]
MVALKKLGEGLVFLWLLTLVAFAVVKLAPGDVVLSMLRIDTVAVTNEQIEALREELGLNMPIWQQYLAYLGSLAHLDFGTSAMTGQPVIAEIGKAFPATLMLAGYALALALILAAILGAVGARFAGRWPDRGVLAFCMLGASIPTFWLALVMLNVFSVRLGVVPSMGMGDGGMILPTVALAFAVAPPYIKILRNSLIESQDLDFVRASRSRGLGEQVIFFRHILRASLIPVVTIAGVSLGSLLGGTVVVEKIFGIPGVGKLMLEALTRRDYAVIQAFIILIGVIVFLINTLVDLSYRWLDPAISLKGKARA